LQTRTLLELRTEVRQRADMEGSELVSDAELTRYINASSAALWDEMIAASEPDYILSDTIATVAGTNLYQLPDEFYRLAPQTPRIDVGGKWRSLRRLAPSDVARMLNDDTGVPSHYKLGTISTGDFIGLYPIPDGVYDVRLYYFRHAEVLVADGDVFGGRNSWEEWIVLDAAIKCLMKEESDVSALVGERERVMARIRQAAAHIDMNEPSAVVDLYRDDSEY
jgi:hypothetical protein